MSIIKIVFIAVSACFFTVIINQYKPEFSFIIRITAVFLIILVILIPLADLSKDLLGLTDNIKINNEYILLLIKVLLISVVCSIASEICADSGNKAIAFCVDLAGRVSIVLLAVPLLKAIFQISKELIKE